MPVILVAAAGALTWTHRDAVQAAASPSCKIRGNISTDGGARIYHLPGQRYYNATSIAPWRGERWFCSESEAQRAGWRSVRRQQSDRWLGQCSPALALAARRARRLPGGGGAGGTGSGRAEASRRPTTIASSTSKNRRFAAARNSAASSRSMSGSTVLRLVGCDEGLYAPLMKVASVRNIAIGIALAATAFWWSEISYQLWVAISMINH